MVTPEVTVTDAASLASAISTYTTIGIGSSEALQQLATIVNSGTSCVGKTFVLTTDLDLSSICAAQTDGEGYGGWIAIGNSSSEGFRGSFNGNGHTITGLYINRQDTDYQGLFGFAGDRAYGGIIKNLGIIDADVTGGECTGILAGNGRIISNCYATGSVTGGNCTGGLVGITY